jgi:hypothetical protein
MANGFLELFNTRFTKWEILSLVRQRPPKDLCDLSPSWEAPRQQGLTWVHEWGVLRVLWKVLPALGLVEN